jgi:hypothetical protein
MDELEEGKESETGVAVYSDWISLGWYRSCWPARMLLTSTRVCRFWNEPGWKRKS